MARRSDHSKDELRALILHSARRFAEEDGLGGLGARRIARDVGYTPGTIYNVFGSLDGLIMEVRADALDELYELSKGIPMDAEPAENLRRLAAAYSGYVIAHSRLWNVIFEHRPEGDPAPDWYRAKVYRLINLIEAAIARLFGRGEESARRHHAWVLWASYHGIVALTVASQFGNPAALRTLAESLIDNYVHALASRKSG